MPVHTTLEPAQAPAAKPAGEPDAVTRYFARIDEITRYMTPAERLVFLRRDRVRWIGFQEEFARRIDGGEFPRPGETAFTYELIVQELSARITREERRS